MKLRIRCMVLALSALLLLVNVTACGAGNSQRLGEYLSPYEEEATAYLLANQEFVAAHGADCTPDLSGFSFTYKDPGKYSSISLSPKIPATAEEFAREVKEILVNYYLPDGRAVTVSFAETPDGSLEITGWAYSHEE